MSSLTELLEASAGRAEVDVTLQYRFSSECLPIIHFAES
jgi:hypothetical protein